MTPAHAEAGKSGKNAMGNNLHCAWVGKKNKQGFQDYFNIQPKGLIFYVSAIIFQFF